ncbi:MAG TPA: hypothetical protein VGQ29_02070 [Gemmatimonadales bacterium]|nr:hypothetical protein [Gemmatimonadales bacterium]
MPRDRSVLALAATLLALACYETGSPVHPPIGAPNLSLGAAQYWDSGFGTLGSGSAGPGSDRQEFDFQVAGDLSGRVFYRDWAVVRSDSTVGTLTVSPTDSGTAITAYRDWSSACGDPTRGAEFDGTGRLDTGALVAFSVRACDNSPADSALDFVQLDISTSPDEYSHGGFLSSGDVAKAGTAAIIFQDGFESGGLSPWSQIDVSIPRYSITTNAARVKSGLRSLEALYTPDTNGAYGMITKWFMPGYDEVYVKFAVMFEEGFQNVRPDGWGMHFFAVAGNRTDDSGSWFGTAGIRPDGTNFFYAGLDPAELSLPTLQPFWFYTYYPDMPCGADYDPLLRNCFGEHFPQMSPAIALTGGQWQEVVVHIRLNTLGQEPPDGSETLWINGTKQIDIQNIRWRTTDSLRLNQIAFVNYLDRAPIPEHVWVDDVFVWRP